MIVPTNIPAFFELCDFARVQSIYREFCMSAKILTNDTFNSGAN